MWTVVVGQSHFNTEVHSASTPVAHVHMYTKGLQYGSNMLEQLIICLFCCSPEVVKGPCAFAFKVSKTR